MNVITTIGALTIASRMTEGADICRFLSLKATLKDKNTDIIEALRFEVRQIKPDLPQTLWLIMRQLL